MSSFTQLVDTITSRAALLEEPPENRADLGYLFIRALRKTVNEVHRGAKADDFTDLSSTSSSWAQTKATQPKR